MGKYFGTDGIRGIAGSELNCDLAFRAGAASACVLGRSLDRKPLFIIGRDTRISGDMITAALIAGLTSGGADVIDMGVLPTPAIAYFTANNAFVDSGVVISASHNPYEHNGIKLFGASGYKLRDEQENEIEALIDDGVDAIFYPCMTYNFNEKLGDNHYNCPVVAYYPEVIGANVPRVRDVKLIGDYVGIHRPKDFAVKMYEILSKHFSGLDKKEVKAACKAAYAERDAFLLRVREKGEEYINIAREKNMPIIVLSGRPYHVDPEINHGIDRLICECGAVVVTEDAVSHHVERFGVGVLNQWTYHSRLYAAAKYIGDKADMNHVQLVSFGCGIDAITTDEVRSILEDAGKIYTQIKIDEITNLGAVKIRLRSLFAACEAKQREGLA